MAIADSGSRYDAMVDGKSVGYLTLWGRDGRWMESYVPIPLLLSNPR
jgi:hypothetical protein